jgi:hypothetical protein
MHRVTECEIVDEYTLRLTFDDGTKQVIDFKPILTGPVFGPLEEPRLFSQVTINQDFGTLEWPNGADIAPNVLYDWQDHLAQIIERRKREASVKQ